MSDLPLQPTARTRLGRGRHHGVDDRGALHALLADALVAHVGVVVDDHPVVLPAAYGYDPDGPDDGGSLYLHGSVAARWLQAGAGTDVCVTITELDGLVAARSGFNHSMNYRSGVVIGRARVVEDDAERARALDLIVDQMIAGRSATLRTPTRKELAATIVLAVPLREASLKVSEGDPEDEPEDVAAGVWAGIVPVHRVLGEAVTSADAVGLAVPAHVLARARTPQDPAPGQAPGQ